MTARTSRKTAAADPASTEPALDPAPADPAPDPAPADPAPETPVDPAPETPTEPAPAPEQPAPDPVDDPTSEAVGDQPQLDAEAEARAAAFAALLAGTTDEDDDEEGGDLSELEAPAPTGKVWQLGDVGPFVVVFDAANVTIEKVTHTAVKGDEVWLTQELADRLLELEAITHL